MKSDNKNSTKILKSAWPVKEAMMQIYDQQLWGGEKDSFYSGDGSHDPKLVGPYCEVVNQFLTSFSEPLVVADLGCGDFNVGRHLYKSAKKYIGIDVVPDLITRNQKQFKAPNLEFQCLDIATDKLPDADCVLIRQVLQHLSNAEILKILPKLKHFQYLILTEHLPEGKFQANKDIISGQGIRLKKSSGVDLTQAPFYLKTLKVTELLTLHPKFHKGLIVTRLYQLF